MEYEEHKIDNSDIIFLIRSILKSSLKIDNSSSSSDKTGIISISTNNFLKLFDKAFSDKFTEKFISKSLLTNSNFSDFLEEELKYYIRYTVIKGTGSYPQTTIALFPIEYKSSIKNRFFTEDDFISLDDSEFGYSFFNADPHMTKIEAEFCKDLDLESNKKSDVIDPVLYVPNEEIGVIIPSIELEDGTKYEFPICSAEVKNNIENSLHTYIYGPHGCGKTTLLKELCKILGKEPYEVDFSAGVDEETFLGTKIATVDEKGNNIIKFQYGIFPRAIMEGRPIIINEIDMAQPNYLAALHGVLEEHDPKLVLMENDAEVLKPEGNGFCVLATANTLGLDESALEYSGTNTLNYAFLDRFDSFFQLNYSDENNLISDILKDTPFLEIKSKLIDLIIQFRSAKKVGSLTQELSTRRVKMLCKKIKTIGLENALKNVILTRIDEDERELVKEIIQRVFPILFHKDNYS